MTRKKTVSMAFILAILFSMGCAHHWGYDRYPQDDFRYGPYQQGEWACPWCGGPGMMGPYGRGMGHGYGAYPGKPGYGTYGPAEPLTRDQVAVLLERYVQSTGNPNIRLGTITDKEDFFEAQIVTKEGSLVDTLHVDKRTGWLRPAY